MSYVHIHCTDSVVVSIPAKLAFKLQDHWCRWNGSQWNACFDSVVMLVLPDAFIPHREPRAVVDKDGNMIAVLDVE